MLPPVGQLERVPGDLHDLAWLEHGVVRRDRRRRGRRGGAAPESVIAPAGRPGRALVGRR